MNFCLKINMFAIFCQKFTKFNSWYFFHELSQIIAICTFVIFVQLICKTTLSYLKQCRRSYPYNMDTIYVIFCEKTTKLNSWYILHKLSEIKILSKCTTLI